MADVPSQPVQPVVVDNAAVRGDDDEALLFTPAQLAVAALFGTPIAAGVFWFFNSKALGRRHAWLAFVAGAALTLGPFAAGTWLQKSLFGIAVLVLWPLGYGLSASLHFPKRAARPWLLVMAVSLGVVLLMMQTELAMNVRGAIVPRPIDEAAHARAGAIDVGYVVGEVKAEDAEAVAGVLDDAGIGKEGSLRLRMSQTPGGDTELRLRVPRGGNDVVTAGKNVAQIAADGLGRCLRMRLLLANDGEVASGRACPRAVKTSTFQTPSGL